jgi:hypothetical protein
LKEFSAGGHSPSKPLKRDALAFQQRLVKTEKTMAQIVQALQIQIAHGMSNPVT